MTASDDNDPSALLGELVAVFKALADPIRLRMVGLMVDRERCGQELASTMAMSPATVSHHLRVLREAGLVSEKRQPPYTFYKLDLVALRESVKRVADRKQVQSLADANPGLPEKQRKILRNFFDGPRLLSIPAQRSKKEVVFEEILRRLPRRKEYGERELSRFIEAIHADFCTIRREFIMGKYMERDKGRYWLTDKGRAVVAAGKR